MLTVELLTHVKHWQGLLQRLGQYRSFFNRTWKESIDLRRRESLGKGREIGACAEPQDKDKDDGCYRGQLYTTTERSAKATQRQPGLC